MPALTPTQHNILVWLNDRDGRLLYGPMSNGLGSCHRYGFSGSSLADTIRLLTGDKLKALGLISHVKDKYPLGYYAITDAGRAAIAKADGR